MALVQRCVVLINACLFAAYLVWDNRELQKATCELDGLKKLASLLDQSNVRLEPYPTPEQLQEVASLREVCIFTRILDKKYIIVLT
jgi:hypothetical protein